MPDEEIRALRAQWEERPTPMMTLRLANVYRGRDRLQEAVEVLQRGLEEHPGHVASRIALGRYWLELDRTEDAARELVSVVSEDPSQLLANKLLVEVYLRLGDSKRARDRLGLYTLLHATDPEIAELEQRLSGMAAGRTTAESVVGFEEEPFDLPEPTGLPELTTEHGPAPLRPVRLYVSGDDEPFAPRLWGDLDEASYLAALFEEGVFADGANGEPAVAESTADAAQEAATEEAATLTLGELYKQQGHPEEAVRIFREVLDRQPGNQQAARALGDLLKEQSWPLSADDLLGGDGEAGSGNGGRKGELLRRYRDRLRSGDG